MRGVRLQNLVGRASARGEHLIVLAGMVMLAAYLTAAIAFPRPGGAIVGDAKHHFVQLRSLVFDHDLDFRNEFLGSYGVAAADPEADWLVSELTPTGLVRNFMPLGPALLWAPLYLLAAGVQTVLAWMGLLAAPTGFEVPLQLMPGVTGVIAATAAAWISYRLARRWTDAPSALVGTIGVWLGSHAFYYALVSPAYSHTASMFTSALFFSYWLSTRGAPSVWRFAALGALAGVSALMRWQDAVFVVVPAYELLAWRASWRQRAAAGTAAATAWLAAFSPQMAVWHVLYGQAFTVPQGPSFLQWTAPHPLSVLFSDNHGLFTWAPLLIFSVIGLAIFLLRHRAFAPQVLLVTVLSWYVNAAVADWWAGEAFGARRFLSLFPLFVVGLATWTQGVQHGTIRTGRVALTVWLIGANWLLLLQYQLFMKGLTDVAPYPSGWFDMWVVRLLVPLRLIAWWRD